MFFWNSQKSLSKHQIRLLEKAKEEELQGRPSVRGKVRACLSIRQRWLPRTSGSRKNGTQADATVQEQFRPWVVSESSRGFQNVGTKTESCKCCLRPLGEEESE